MVLKFNNTLDLFMMILCLLLIKYSLKGKVMRVYTGMCGFMLCVVLCTDVDFVYINYDTDYVYITNCIMCIEQMQSESSQF